MVFELYSEIKIAYILNQQLCVIYNNNNGKHIAMTKLVHCIGMRRNGVLKTLISTQQFNSQLLINPKLF